MSLSESSKPAPVPAVGATHAEPVRADLDLITAHRPSVCSAAEGIETIHIVGGASANSEAIEHGIADVLYVTRVLTEHDTDVRMGWPLAGDSGYQQVACGVSHFVASGRSVLSAVPCSLVTCRCGCL